MDIKKYTADGREATLYMADKENRPLVILNNYSGDGSSVVKALEETGCPDLNLLCVGNLNWNHDMTPWRCPALSPDDEPCTGGADDYLKLLISDILPKAKELVSGVPSHIGIAGYSLGGLFALYACYSCDVFDRAASVSGSLWFPDFKDYVFSHFMKKIPDKVYLSLGDAEAKTKHPLLKTVQDNTEEIVGQYKKLGLNVTWELNPGNHFKNAALRSAKGITAIL
ncbi:MAG: alpha/beta hydrolase [Ruminococcus sp.]|nr:alpha/beta hydrolase [Ruminococcus sp.]